MIKTNLYNKIKILLFILLMILAINLGVNSKIYYVQASEGINVTIHTEEDIRAYIDTHDVYNNTLYVQMPNQSYPYSEGIVATETLQGALNTLNIVRYIAGIPANVELDTEYTKMAQVGCLINAVNRRLEHTPAKPLDMDETLYQIGYEGTSSSNLCYGYSSLKDAILYGWMYDGDSSNIDRVGHRRWILNPSMKKTGFGVVGAFTSMYAFDRGNDANQYGVAWPAQVMPIELFEKGSPWSISMGYQVDAMLVNVKLTNTSTGQIWNFSNSYADGDFYVNNDGYGQTGCIIFKPWNLSAYKSGDIYRVEISGLNEPVSYEVKFFNLYPEVVPSYENEINYETFIEETTTEEIMTEETSIVETTIHETTIEETVSEETTTEQMTSNDDITDDTTNQETTLEYFITDESSVNEKEIIEEGEEEQNKRSIRFAEKSIVIVVIVLMIIILGGFVIIKKVIVKYKNKK